ncbi:winged helix-turn-helix domain-containing protein [Pantoea endophytica]
MNNINCKREIIRIVWPDKHMYVNDNNYHQLVFQLRRLFQKNGLSRDLISTIPFYGLTINENRLKSLSRFNDDLITSTLSETKINEKKTSFLSNIYAKQKQ